MIRLAQREDHDRFLEILGKAPFFAAEMDAAWNTCTRDLFFFADERAVLWLHGGRAMLYGPLTNTQEMSEFLAFQRIECLQSMDWIPPDFEPEEQWILEYLPSSARHWKCPNGYFVDQQPILYQAATACITPDVTNVPADEWAAQACARRNKCGADIWALKKQNEYAAIAGIFAMTSHEAYIAGVVTAREHRREGCASYLVTSLARQYSSCNRTVRLVCRKPMIPFYEKFGFVPKVRIWQSKRRSE
ncbi:GNAT family N-acetyltransferase [uncultured Ruthenibacterium sp.]|uniref:GNAT family N-acetyltransferase n=1 Tax=uncultured Ruthenibacterium sp. TaxID=1905347 RepID=UPI00349E9A28